MLVVERLGANSVGPTLKPYFSRHHVRVRQG